MDRVDRLNDIDNFHSRPPVIFSIDKYDRGTLDFNSFAYVLKQ